MPPSSPPPEREAGKNGAPPVARDAAVASEPPKPATSGHAPAGSLQRTLPPPEWLGREGPRSAASLALERYRLGTAVARRNGARAELASLAARL
jgi:hypothetical protein